MVSRRGLHTTRRWFCCEAPQQDQGKTLTMEGQLRKLFMLVHPDRFHGFPKARDQNEDSFKRLTEFLDTMKRSALPTSSQSFPLQFFLLPDSEAPAKGVEDLKTAEITLRAGGTTRDKKRQLGALFDLCGIEGDFIMTGGTEGAGEEVRASDEIEQFVLRVRYANEHRILRPSCSLFDMRR